MGFWDPAGPGTVDLVLAVHSGDENKYPFRGREQVPVRCVGARTVLNTSHTLLDADSFICYCILPFLV